jgi:3-polyprenyl-4-hydroxybenzoate decarboxylase
MESDEFVILARVEATHPLKVVYPDNGKWTVVVDDDVDCSDMDQVLWAMGTGFDSVTEPMFLPGNFNNRILIDACQPYNRKLHGKFPKVVEVPENVREQLRRRFSQIFKTRP